MKYANLVIDNKSDHTDQLYTYGVRDDAAKTGSKVYVPFAQGKRLRRPMSSKLTITRVTGWETGCATSKK